MSFPRKTFKAALPCPGCGYDLRGAPRSPKATAVCCPECGAKWLPSQLADKWRRPDDQPRLGPWGMVAALSPAVLSALVVGWGLVTYIGNPKVLFAVAMTTPVTLIPLANWRYRHHRSWQKRIPRIIAFIILYLFLNALLFLLLIVALIITVFCIDPNHFTA